MKAPLTIDVDLTPAQLAEIFCAGNDEDQAQFFIEVARIAGTWAHNGGMQWFNVGRHLRDCPCSTEEARDLIREIATATERS